MKKENWLNEPFFKYFCYFCRRKFYLTPSMSPNHLKKVYLGEDILGVCCPACEHKELADAPSLPQKYPQGYVMRGDDGELRILHGKSWYLVREGDIVNFNIEEI